jgi:hypothetical protein
VCVHTALPVRYTLYCMHMAYLTGRAQMKKLSAPTQRKRKRKRTSLSDDTMADGLWLRVGERASERAFSCKIHEHLLRQMGLEGSPCCTWRLARSSIVYYV